ncbi:hypothetical protein, conserved [Eimeria brunetti]|uniref:Uncharacterized protein n=1 Tax=Eimeria brunetti TaxID=51314 RepID=U6LQ67_9EIME|nr:hypothetical protein, conserved [Eimeria brunetti]
MDWNEATATNLDLHAYEFDLRTPTEAFHGPQFPLNDARLWVFDQQSPSGTTTDQMPGVEEGNTPVKNSGEASGAAPPLQRSGSGKGKLTVFIGSLAVLSLALVVCLASLLPTRQKLAVTLPPPQPVEAPPPQPVEEPPPQRVEEPSPQPFPPPMDKENAEECIEKLSLSADNLKTMWKTSSSTIRAAFKHHFTPFGKEGLKVRGNNVLNVLEEQVDYLLLNRPNDDSSEEEKEEFLKNAQLLRAICEASAERLRELGRLDSIARAHEIRIPLIDVAASEDRPDFDFGDDLEAEKPVTFGEFLKMLPKPKEEILALADSAGDAVVPRRIAATLADLIRVEGIESEDDNYICEHFDRFASTFGFRLGNMDDSDLEKAEPLRAIFDVKPFKSRDFFKFLKYRYERTLESYVDPLIFHHLAKNWNEQRAEELVEQIIDDQRRRTQDLIQQKVMTLLATVKKGQPGNTLFMFSMFLL